MRDALVNEFAGSERKLRAIARQDENAQRLMTTPGVGVLVALTFVAAVDAPGRFRSSRAVGPHFGLTQRPLQKDRIMYQQEPASLPCRGFGIAASLSGLKEGERSCQFLP
ncbi:transposase [Sinorhizobium meliloti]|uniref:transposase n=1 Tax=Rhizobium meliloti TaxID=382 RepID=UPI001F24B8B1|nr:transposase [Sinorhizobium meliloti]